MIRLHPFFHTSKPIDPFHLWRGSFVRADAECSRASILTAIETNAKEVIGVGQAEATYPCKPSTATGKPPVGQKGLGGSDAVGSFLLW